MITNNRPVWGARFDFLFGIVQQLKSRRMSQDNWFFSFTIKDTFTSLYNLVLLPKHALHIQCTYNTILHPVFFFFFSLPPPLVPQSFMHSIMERVKLLSGRRHKSDLWRADLSAVGGSLWQPVSQLLTIGSTQPHCGCTTAPL